MTNRQPDGHAAHDLLLMSVFAAGDASPAERETATALTDRCPDCARLADDLQVIARATAALPAPARRRDFMLSPGDAARIRRRGWRRLAGVFEGPRFAFTRPLAAGLTTLGLAGFLLAAIPSFGLGAAAPSQSGSGQERLSADQAASPEVGHQYNSGSGPQPAAGGASPQPVTLAGEPDRDVDTTDDRSDGPAAVAPRDPRAASPLAVLSGTFLIVGLGLFGLRWSARHLGNG